MGPEPQPFQSALNPSHHAASIKPDERKPDEGLLFPPLQYADYLKNTEKLWEFSRERVAAGSLEAMLPRDGRTQRLRKPVDEVFLDEMTGCREELARNVYKNNHELAAKQLNEVVQRLLDRIIFVRIAEDRHIVEKRQLADAVDEWHARGGNFGIVWCRNVDPVLALQPLINFAGMYEFLRQLSLRHTRLSVRVRTVSRHIGPAPEFLPATV